MATKSMMAVLRKIRARILPRPQATPRGGHEEGAEWYDALYETSENYNCHYTKSHYYFLWAVIVDRMRLAGIRSILEIGCGPGQLAAFLMDQGVSQFVGLDFSPKAIDIARKNVSRGSFVVADARSPEIHHQVDHEVVICTEVLEHIEDDFGVLSRFLPGKRCICSVPNFPHESHVRHFHDAAEMIARYGPFFRDLDVFTLKSPRLVTDEFFLFDGVRNDYVSD